MTKRRPPSHRKPKVTHCLCPRKGHRRGANGRGRLELPRPYVHAARLFRKQPVAKPADFFQGRLAIEEFLARKRNRELGLVRVNLGRLHAITMIDSRVVLKYAPGSMFSPVIAAVCWYLDFCPAAVSEHIRIIFMVAKVGKDVASADACAGIKRCWANSIPGVLIARSMHIQAGRPPICASHPSRRKRMWHVRLHGFSGHVSRTKVRRARCSKIC
jgi:hypothetical protein